MGQVSGFLFSFVVVSNLSFIAFCFRRQAEDIFIESFAATLNQNRKNDNLVEPGDVVILNASPWRASDDTIFGTKSLAGEDEELGMQLVVETSLFNYNAELPPSNRGTEVPLVTCHDSDLKPLANIALKIHKKLAEPNFVDLMVERMKSDEALGEKQMSPFFYTFEDRKLAEESQVVTSWTIKTDIGSGSSKIDFDAFGHFRTHMNFMFLTLLITIIAFTYWSLRHWSIGKKTTAMTGTITNADQTPRERRRGKYSRVNAREFHPTDDGDSIMAIADDYHDERSTMTSQTEYTTSSDASGGESFRSIGSLSVYLARTSKVPREA